MSPDNPKYNTTERDFVFFDTIESRHQCESRSLFSSAARHCNFTNLRSSEQCSENLKPSRCDFDLDCCNDHPTMHTKSTILPSSEQSSDYEATDCCAYDHPRPQRSEKSCSTQEIQENSVSNEKHLKSYKRFKNDVVITASIGTASEPLLQQKLQRFFEAPPDLVSVHVDTFYEIRKAAKEQKKFLLVCIQNINDSYDKGAHVWEDDEIKDTVLHTCVLWIQYHDSREGRAYVEKYSVRKYPHIGIIEPKTRELLWQTSECFSSEQLKSKLFELAVQNYPGVSVSNAFMELEKKLQDALACTKEEKYGQEKLQQQLQKALAQVEVEKHEKEVYLQRIYILETQLLENTQSAPNKKETNLKIHDIPVSIEDQAGLLVEARTQTKKKSSKKAKRQQAPLFQVVQQKKSDEAFPTKIEVLKQESKQTTDNEVEVLRCCLAKRDSQLAEKREILKQKDETIRQKDAQLVRAQVAMADNQQLNPFGVICNQSQEIQLILLTEINLRLSEDYKLAQNYISKLEVEVLDLCSEKEFLNTNNALEIEKLTAKLQSTTAESVSWRKRYFVVLSQLKEKCDAYEKLEFAYTNELPTATKPDKPN